MWGMLEYEPTQDLAAPHLGRFALSFAEVAPEERDTSRRELVQGLGCVHMVVSTESCVGARALLVHCSAHGTACVCACVAFSLMIAAERGRAAVVD